MLRLDVRSLHKGGTLDAGRAGLITWTRWAGSTSSVSFYGLGHALKLVFRVRIDGGDWDNVTQTVHLERTRCRFGGERPWFLCPRCGRRVAVLYGERLFLCRTCHGLAYASQNEAQHDRILRRANKIRSRLGGKAGLSSIIMKPKRMRWKTFELMQEEIRQFETAGLLLAMKRFGVEL